METYDDLAGAIGTVDFPGEALISRAVLDGRRVQRRRRLGTAVGALAVGALAVTAGLHLGGRSPAADGTAVAARTTASSASDPGDGSVALPTAELTDARLTALLPVPGDPVSTEAPGGYVDVQRTLDPDGAGTGTVTLSLEAEPPLSQTQISGADQKCQLVDQFNGPESCRPLADGWMWTYTSHPDLQNASPKALDWSATVVRKDGTSVSLHATNYVDHSNPTRQAPVLDLNQIAAIANDPVWFQPAP